jgi:hypothetical protein
MLKIGRNHFALKTKTVRVSEWLGRKWTPAWCHNPHMHWKAVNAEIGIFHGHSIIVYIGTRIAQSINISESHSGETRFNPGYLVVLHVFIQSNLAKMLTYFLQRGHHGILKHPLGFKFRSHPALSHSNPALRKWKREYENIRGVIYASQDIVSNLQRTSWFFSKSHLQISFQLF